MHNKQKQPLHTILNQAEHMEGDTKVIITEYTDGSHTHKEVRSKRPFYKRVWLYLLIALAFFTLLAVTHYWL
jgi:hypothetical protein